MSLRSKATMRHDLRATSPEARWDCEDILSDAKQAVWATGATGEAAFSLLTAVERAVGVPPDADEFDDVSHMAQAVNDAVSDA